MLFRWQKFILSHSCFVKIITRVYCLVSLIWYVLIIWRARWPSSLRRVLLGLCAVTRPQSFWYSARQLQVKSAKLGSKGWWEGGREDVSLFSSLPRLVLPPRDLSHAVFSFTMPIDWKIYDPLVTPSLAVISVFTSHVVKTKILTIKWIKSRIRDTIDDWYIKNLAKNQVSAVFLFARYLQKCITQIYRALYGDAMFVSFWGTQTWRP